MDHPSPKTILILAANPINTKRLRLAEELDSIEAALQRSTLRDHFIIRYQHAARPDKVRQALLTHNPHLVHFCGHGAGEEGIYFQDDDGRAVPVSGESLADLVRLFPSLECVVLNACLTDVQAAALEQYVGYVVGMVQKVGDATARQFANGFYDGLFAGRSIEHAFELGRNALHLGDIPDELTPVLRGRLPRQQATINREGALALFDELVQPDGRLRILLLAGQAKMGKTHLLTKVFPLRFEQHLGARSAVLDLRNPMQNGMDLINDLCMLLGDHRFPITTELLQLWLNRPIHEDRSLKEALASASRDHKEIGEVQRRLQEVTRSFVNDLRVWSDERVLLIFDSVNAAGPQTQQWLLNTLLVQLFSLTHVRAVVGGRILPQTNGAYAAFAQS